MTTERAETLPELLRAYWSVAWIPETPDDFEGATRLRRLAGSVAVVLATVTPWFLAADLIRQWTSGTPPEFVVPLVLIGVVVSAKLWAWPVGDRVAGVPKEVPA